MPSSTLSPSQQLRTWCERYFALESSIKCLTDDLAAIDAEIAHLRYQFNANSRELADFLKGNLLPLDEIEAKLQTAVGRKLQKQHELTTVQAENSRYTCAISQLSQVDQAIIRFHFRESLTWEQTAKRLDLTAATVRRHGMELAETLQILLDSF